MKRYIYILSAIAVVIGLPLAFKRTKLAHPAEADDTLIIITPHNEAIRLEMDLGFREWYQKKTGRTVAIDWRVPGSTGDIVRYVDSMFVNAFRLHWENVLHQKWSAKIQESFSQLHPEDAEGQQARDAFIHSDVGCGIDLFFGGGVVEYKREADKGHTVSSGVIESHPEIFCDDCIPLNLSGDILWDPKGTWIGASLSSFGIMYNTDRISDLKFSKDPTQWADLTSPKLYRQIAMVDPIQSSVVIKCLQMILQQQMKFVRSDILSKTHRSELTADELHEVLNKGWLNGLKIIQKIMANSRYFTDNSVTTVWDVCMGNCSVGIVVDFYGRHQRELTRSRGGSDRLRFVLPKGASCISPDPIAMFRGAPHKSVAQAFIEYVVSEEGQDRIGFKIGTPHGPQYYAIHRTPVRKDFYKKEKQPYMSTPDMNPFLEEDEFPYQPKWLDPAFGAIRMLSKVLFMDPFTELAKAWKAIIDAEQEGRFEQAKRAEAVMSDLDELTYDWVIHTLNPILKAKNPLLKIQLETELTQKFRDKYLMAYKIATGK